MSRELVSGPAAEPVTVAELRLHCRIDHTDEDVLLAGLIASARQWCERYSGRAFLRQRWRTTVERWPSDGVLPLRPLPLLGVVAVEWQADDGTWTAVPTGWQLTPARDGLRWTEMPGGDAVAWRVDYDAGYGDDATDVPERIRQAVMVLAAWLYEQREGAQEVPAAVRALLDLDRLVGVL